MRAPPLPGATSTSGRLRVDVGDMPRRDRRGGGLRAAAGARSATPSTRRKRCATWFHSMSHCPGRPLRQRSSATLQREPAKAPKRSRAAGAAAMRQRVAAALVPAAMAARSRTSGVACAAAARFSRRLVVRSRSPATAPATMAGRASRPQRLLDRPQRVLVGAGLDEQQPADVEAELGEAVAVGLAEVRERRAAKRRARPDRRASAAPPPSGRTGSRRPPAGRRGRPRPPRGGRRRPSRGPADGPAPPARRATGAGASAPGAAVSSLATAWRRAAMRTARGFPPPLWGRVGDGGEPQTSAVVDPPTPNPSPQGGGGFHTWVAQGALLREPASL